MAEEEVMELRELGQGPVSSQPIYLIVADIQHSSVKWYTSRDIGQIHLGAAHYV